MAVIKPKDMPPFGVLSIFGQSYNNYTHSEKLFRLIMEIEFKWWAVVTAYELLLKQIKLAQSERKDKTPRARSYKIEIELMTYLGFFLDSIYALTERISDVTKIFLDYRLKDKFRQQRKNLINNPNIDHKLSKLMASLSWYDLFIELRTQHSHYGTAILAYGYDNESQEDYPQLVIEIGGNKKGNVVLIVSRYKFDLRKTSDFKDGLEQFIQDWSLILLKKLDMNATMFGVKDGLPLKKFMEGRKA